MVGQLVVVACFFATRSRKYSGVHGKRMTTIVGVDDARFSREPRETSQLIGRWWRSRTFMRYPPLQVPASTQGVSTKMTSLDSF